LGFDERRRERTVAIIRCGDSGRGGHLAETLDGEVAGHIEQRRRGRVADGDDLRAGNAVVALVLRRVSAPDTESAGTIAGGDLVRGGGRDRLAAVEHGRQRRG